MVSWWRVFLQCGRPGFNPWVGKIHWRKERLPTPVFWPGEFHGLYSPWNCKESDTAEWPSLALRWFYMRLTKEQTICEHSDTLKLYTIRWNQSQKMLFLVHSYSGKYARILPHSVEIEDVLLLPRKKSRPEARVPGEFQGVKNGKWDQREKMYTDFLKSWLCVDWNDVNTVF